MSVGAAREAAVDWVLRHASRQDGFRGAYFSGPTVGVPPKAELPTGSDVDVVVVTAAAEPPPPRPLSSSVPISRPRRGRSPWTGAGS
jgi:hypothetical protein